MQPFEIVLLRKRFNLNQTEFAKLMGVRNMTVSRWETGRSKPHKTFVSKMREWQRAGKIDYQSQEGVR